MKSLLLSIPLLAAAVFGQSVLTFTRVDNAQDLREITTAIRSITDIANMRLDEGKKTLTIEGNPHQIALAEWLFGGLNVPATSLRFSIARDFKFAGDEREGDVRIYYLANTEAGKPIQDLAVKVRTAAQIRRLFTLSGQRALVLRGTPEQLTQADRIIRELDRKQ